MKPDYVIHHQDEDGKVHELLKMHGPGCIGCVGNGANSVLNCGELPACNSDNHGDRYIFVPYSKENLIEALKRRMEYA